jgi:trehalose 6-phosphate synthase
MEVIADGDLEHFQGVWRPARRTGSSRSRRPREAGAPQPVARAANVKERMLIQESIVTELRARLQGRRLVVVSNREPYVHTREDGRVVCRTPAGGLVAALDPVLRACGGTWLAYGGGDADRETADTRGRVAVPEGDPGYTLRRVWLDDEAEYRRYYDGFSNSALWPLCHRAFVRPHFDPDDWTAYRAVNQRFADTVLDEVGGGDALVFVQDYHFALLPRMLRAARPDLTIAQFWHIPWPSRDVFGVCPWADEILDGLLANDLLGFHVGEYRDAFLDTVDRRVEAVVDHCRARVRRRGHTTAVAAVPIGVDADQIAADAASPDVAAEADRVRAALGLEGQLVGLGVDRLDYTKGIPERLHAVDRFLARHPQYRCRFTYLQLGPLSRTSVPEYARLFREVRGLAAAINARHAVGTWEPVRLLVGDYPRRTLLAYYRLADVCLVSPLHDGMNLVAKEYVAARPDGGGALVLSRFAGAARELDGALLVNPFDVDGFARAISRALELPEAEARGRMARMQSAVRRATVYHWAAALIGRASETGLDFARLGRRLLAEAGAADGDTRAVEGARRRVA